MLDRRCPDPETLMSHMTDGTSIMVSGFGEAGRPNTLIKMVLDSGARDLHVISNNAGEGVVGLAALFANRRVSRLTCSFPRGTIAPLVQELLSEARLTLDVVPQGTLAERIRAAGAGIPAFFTPTGYGTRIAEGKETRLFDGRGHVLETALSAPLGLVKAHKADRWGNLTFRNLARNFSPLMAAACETTLVEADEIVELGDLAPGEVQSPGIFTDHLILSRPLTDADWSLAA